MKLARHFGAGMSMPAEEQVPEGRLTDLDVSRPYAARDDGISTPGTEVPG